MPDCTGWAFKLTTMENAILYAFQWIDTGEFFTTFFDDNRGPLLKAKFFETEKEAENYAWIMGGDCPRDKLQIAELKIAFKDN